jgi:hypothetical protein
MLTSVFAHLQAMSLPYGIFPPSMSSVVTMRVVGGVGNGSSEMNITISQ